MTEWMNFPGAPTPGTVLIAGAEVPEGVVRKIVLGEKPKLFRAIVTRVDGVARAFVNLCPHFRLPLAVEGRDLTLSPGLVWCGFHSAQFRVSDGRCVDGPAKGAALTPIPVVEIDGAIAITGANLES